MGVMNHNAILATTWQPGAMVAFLERFKDHQHRFMISEPQINKEQTVCVFPDGSKEGWPKSKQGDEFRDSVIKYFDREAEKEEHWWMWIEVGYGEFGQKILRGNNTNQYNDKPYAND